KRLLAFLLAFILAATAQRTLNKGGVANDAAILFALAALVFVVAAEGPAPWPELPPRRPWPRWALGLAGGALLLGIAAFVLFWRGRGLPTQFSGPAFWLWLASFPLFLVAVGLGEKPSLSENTPHAPRNSPLTSRFTFHVSRITHHPSRWELMFLLLILLAALFLRTWQLDAIPNGCQSDECNNGLDALKWLSGAPYTPYAET
ncbi:MAG: hypothetical protein QHJ81_16515, partial [Anaerolineae bacterium]|nr:hypothetical protein [Anaerolineae bacterium]